MLLQLISERRRMLGGQPQIFVHVEGIEPLPVHFSPGHERGEKLVLARSGSENSLNCPPLPLTGSQDVRYELRSSLTKGPAVFINPDQEGVDPELIQRRNQVYSSRQGEVPSR